MDFEATTTTTAAPERAWAALVDVESWPQWTASMRSVQRLDRGDLGLGSRARIRQPGLPPAVWKVTEFEPGRGFSWAATAPGVRTIGHHRIATEAGGTVRLTLGLEQQGLLAPLMRRLIAARTRRFLGLELDGWKAASEAGTSGPA